MIFFFPFLCCPFVSTLFRFSPSVLHSQCVPPFLVPYEIYLQVLFFSAFSLERFCFPPPCLVRHDPRQTASKLCQLFFLSAFFPCNSPLPDSRFPNMALFPTICFPSPIPNFFEFFARRARAKSPFFPGALPVLILLLFLLPWKSLPGISFFPISATLLPPPPSYPEPSFS